MSSLTEPLVVDVVSDVVCPWCYIGKRRLEAALATRGAGAKSTVRWHPFQLNPDLPRGGIDRRSYLEGKFGDPERIEEVQQRIEAAGRDAGVWFEFERVQRQPNTLDAHRLIAWSQSVRPSVTNELVEHLFRAYFTQGVDIGNIEELARIAGSVGLDAFKAKALLTSDEGRAAVRAGERRAHELGVTGVPLFIFNQRVAVSGAQHAKVLREAIAQSEVATITR